MKRYFPFFLKLTLCSIIVVLCITLNNCNTIQGAGRDIQRAGEALEDAAN